MPRTATDNCVLAGVCSNRKFEPGSGSESTAHATSLRPVAARHHGAPSAPDLKSNLGQILAQDSFGWVENDFASTRGAEALLAASKGVGLSAAEMDALQGRQYPQAMLTDVLSGPSSAHKLASLRRTTHKLLQLGYTQQYLACLAKTPSGDRRLESLAPRSSVLFAFGFAPQHLATLSLAEEHDTIFAVLVLHAKTLRAAGLSAERIVEMAIGPSGTDALVAKVIESQA